MNYLYEQWIKTRKTTDGLAIVDLSTLGNVVSIISESGKRSNIEHFLFDVIPIFEDELQKKIFSYETRTILICDGESFAFIVPSFTFSSGMYILAVPSVSLRAVSFAIKSGMLGDILTLGEIPEYARVSKLARSESHTLKEWLCCFEECFGARLENDHRNSGDIIRERIMSIADFVGVDVRSVIIDDIKETEKFDFGLFTSFITVTLMQVFRRSCDKGAMIKIGSDDHGIFIKVDFKFEKYSPRYDGELVAIKGIADRKRVLFEILEESEKVSVRFFPIIEDWSLLEVKVPDEEEVEFELT